MAVGDGSSTEGAVGGSSPALEGRRCLADYNPLEREEYEEVCHWSCRSTVLSIIMSYLAGTLQTQCSAKVSRINPTAVPTLLQQHSASIAHCQKCLLQ